LQVPLDLQKLSKLCVILEAVDIARGLGAQEDARVLDTGPFLPLHVLKVALLKWARWLQLIELDRLCLSLIFHLNLNLELAWLYDLSILGVVHNGRLLNETLLDLLLVAHWTHKALLLTNVLWVRLILSRFLDRCTPLLREGLRGLSSHVLDLDDTISVMVVLVALLLVAIGLRLSGLAEEAHDAVAKALEVV
jgi:hypothetical protein